MDSNKHNGFEDENITFEDNSQSIFEDADRNSKLPEARLSEDIYADIMKNDDGAAVYEEHTTRREKYHNDTNLSAVDNPFQSDRNEKTDESEEKIEQYADFDAQHEETKQIKTFNETFSDFFKRVFPNKEDKKSEFIRKLIADISVFVLVGCAIAFAVIFVQSHKAEKQQSGIASQIIEISDEEQEQKLWEEFRAKYPNIKTPEGMMAKYAYLYALNPQLVGWVSVPNSSIDVQVVQSPNNSDYLKKDFYGNYSRYGCPFMDYRNDPRFLNQNTIIYGHHMSDGLIFADLSKYKTLDGFLAAPIINFDTIYDSYKFKIYAVILTNSREQDDNGYVFNYTVTNFGSTQNFEDYIKAIDERKLYTTGVDINSADKLLTLSTCSYEFTDARFVVIGRMMRTGETTGIDTSYATISGNPRYPQIWYDAKGITNPYANADRWYPESQ
ncbi:MAG: class B sortase [Ruminococcaceae bacterium]|nr:class B sortase [Oscillospiraceae bacterium]